MKNFVFSAIAIVIVFMALGCSGYARYKNGFETATGYREESGATFFPNPENSADLARAEYIRSQAIINIAMAKNIEKGESFLENKYLGVVINDDTQKTIIFRHPFLDTSVEVYPESSCFIEGPEIPETIYVKFSEWKHFEELPFRKRQKIYQGRKIDYGIRIDYRP